MKTNDARYINGVNPRLAVTPVGNGARKEHMLELDKLDELWISRVRSIHNPIGNWANAMMHKGLTREQVLETLDMLVAEIKETSK